MSEEMLIMRKSTPLAHTPIKDLALGAISRVIEVFFQD